MEIRLKILLFSLLGLTLAGASCEEEAVVVDSDALLARVYNKTLYLSDLEGLFPPAANKEDSTQIINSYIERWTRDAVLLYEAEMNIPQDLNIDKLVKDYRASLIRHNYEKILVESGLDSVISQKELIDFYEKNKEKYILEQTILRCRFIKTALPIPDARQLKKLWESNSPADKESLFDYCSTFAVAYALSDSVWYTLDQLATEIPLANMEKVRQAYRNKGQFADENYQYYVQILEWREPSDIAPLEYIEEEAKKVILRKRMTDLLEDKKEEMYETALKNKVIQLYLD